MNIVYDDKQTFIRLRLEAGRHKQTGIRRHGSDAGQNR